MITVDDALERILGAIAPLPPRTVTLEAAVGQFVRRDVNAQLFNPAFDVSAMDGYAVRAQDLSPGATLTMIGTSQAGAGFSGVVGKGQCARIFTGAPLPTGADAVVMQEETRAEGSSITFESSVPLGRSIRFRGEDFAKNEVLLKAGDRLSSQKLALAAAGNIAELSVSTLPRIALITTGDELVLPGSAVGRDQIVASNSVGLHALFSPYAREIVDLGIVADNRDALGATLGGALANAPDILITTGGASVGEHDLVQEMLEANGVAIDFWRIAMRPGKPLMFGRHGKTLIFGLPGNPVSALVTARLFVLPAILAMCGTTPPAPMVLPLANALPPNGNRRHFLRGIFYNDPTHGTRIDPISQTDSGHLTSLASADALIEQQEYCPGKPEGALVKVYPL